MSTSLPGYTAVPGADGEHVTFCRICEALCGMVATVRDGRVVKLRPDIANPHSRGHICVKGVAMTDVTNDPDRVVRPLKRVGGPGEFEPVAWDQALGDIAARLDAIVQRHGPDAFATMYGNPPAFGMASFMAPGQFQAALGATKTFSPNTEDTSSPLLAHAMLYGTTSYVFPDLPECEHLLIFGSNPLVSHGSLIIAPRFKDDLEAIAARGKVIVFDPRRTETAQRYEHQPLLPDSDVFVLAAMINAIADAGLADEATLSSLCIGWPELREGLRPITPELASAQSGIPPARIVELALDFARAERAAAMGRLGICRGSFPTLANVLLHALNIVAGKFHKPGCVGFGHGATDSGEMLAAAGLKGRDADASRVSDLPAVVGSLPSVTMYDELTLGEDRVRALLVSGSNAVLSKPGGHRLPEAFAGLELMFALDLYVTETTQHAHYILPVTTLLEREDVPIIFGGHMVRPFMQYVPAVTEPRGEARLESDILGEIARRMGRGEAFGTMAPVDAVDFILRNGPEGKGTPTDLSIEKLKQHPHGIMLERGRWAFTLAEKLRHEDGKIHLCDPLIAPELERLARTSPPVPGGLRMFSMRKLRSINSWMHNVERLVRSDRPRLLIHPHDAAERGVEDGATVRVSTRWGAVEVEAEVTDEVIAGSVCYPHGWGHRAGWRRANAQPGANINTIVPSTPDSAEKVSGMTFIDGFAVEVEALAAAPA